MVALAWPQALLSGAEVSPQELLQLLGAAQPMRVLPPIAAASLLVPRAVAVHWPAPAPCWWRTAARPEAPPLGCRVRHRASGVSEVDKWRRAETAVGRQ